MWEPAEDRVDEVLQAWSQELPEVLTPTTELTKRITLLAAALAEETRRQVSRLELTVAEYDVLVALRRSGGRYRMRPSVLARELLLSSGGITKVLRALTARRLVERWADDRDGRVAWVGLTPAGVELAERAVRATSDAHRELFSGLPAETIETASAALRQVTAVLR